MNSHKVSAENLIEVFPQALKKDKSLLALASSIAGKLANRAEEIRSIQIYSSIDDLPEELLDILAKDFKLDWYDYNYPLEAKRSLLKSCWSVHRRLGTKGAISQALSGIYPGSTVEEWFEYDGEPYFFRVILDVTNQRVDISHTEIVRNIDVYKSLRSKIEEDAIYYRSRNIACIRTDFGAVVYGSRLCGTYPHTAMQGTAELQGLTVGASGKTAAYKVKRCGAKSIF